MAHLIAKNYEKAQNSDRKKLLVILNQVHAIPHPQWIDPYQKRAAQYLAERYGMKNIKSILINSVDLNENLLQNGYWDASFAVAKMSDVAFDFANTPFGNDIFDYAKGKNNEDFTYDQLFHGFIFYKPIAEHLQTLGIENYVNDEFRDEFLRRIKIYNGADYYEELKKDSILLGFDKVENTYYDNQELMIERIEFLKTAYLKKVEEEKLNKL